jgi:hypothetical protein
MSLLAAIFRGPPRPNPTTCMATIRPGWRHYAILSARREHGQFNTGAMSPVGDNCGEKVENVNF